HRSTAPSPTSRSLPPEPPVPNQSQTRSTAPRSKNRSKDQSQCPTAHPARKSRKQSQVRWHTKPQESRKPEADHGTIAPPQRPSISNDRSPCRDSSPECSAPTTAAPCRNHAENKT